MPNQYPVMRKTGDQVANLNGHRQRLVVLLGAGSTMHANAPSTDDITDHLCTRVRGNALMEQVIKGLCEQRGALGFNFESVMSALESLQDYVQNKRYPPMVGGEAGAFTAFKPDYERFLRFGNADDPFYDPFFGLLWQLKQIIAEYVIARTQSSCVSGLSAFIGRLKKHFDLTVVTLNYDDLIDRAGVWFDGFGFAPVNDAGEYQIFDHAAFLARASSDPAVLLHLHGSVRFGRNPGCGSYVVKYQSAQEAQQSFNQTMTRGPGEIAIVSGDKKLYAINSLFAPLGYYHNTFVNAALNCPLWLIAGYGGNDAHVNHLIQESAWIHGGRGGRIVHIDPAERPSWPFLPRGNVHWTPPKLRSYNGSERGNFPPSGDSLNEIIEFLCGGNS